MRWNQSLSRITPSSVWIILFNWQNLNLFTPVSFSPECKRPKLIKCKNCCIEILALIIRYTICDQVRFVLLCEQQTNCKFTQTNLLSKEKIVLKHCYKTHFNEWESKAVFWTPFCLYCLQVKIIGTKKHILLFLPSTEFMTFAGVEEERELLCVNFCCAFFFH